MKSSWTACTIKDYIDRGEAELTTGPFGTQLHARDYVKQGTPVINVRNIGLGDIRDGDLEFIGTETVDRLSTHLLFPGDIVFGRKGAVERHAFLRNKHARWFQGSDCLRLRFKSSAIDARFVSYAFLTDSHKQWMVNHCSHGATMASLNQDIVSRIPLQVPPRSVQSKIVSILSAYDDLIENNTRRIKILEEMAQRLYREWLVDFRFPGHEKVRMVDSELGKIPEGWAVESFANCADFVNGYAFKPSDWSESGIPIIKIRELKDGVAGDTPRYNGEALPAKYEINNGDILFSWSADLETYFWSGGAALLNQHLFNVHPRKDLSKCFLFFALRQQMPEFRAKSQGTTMKHIKRSALYQVMTIIPSVEARNRFEEMALPILLQERNLQERSRALRSTRDLLLPKLISGELDVSELRIAVGEELTA